MKFLPAEARKHGIRTIIRDLIRVAGKLVRHARRWKLLFSKSALRLDWLAHAADCLASSGLYWLGGCNKEFHFWKTVQLRPNSAGLRQNRFENHIPTGMGIQCNCKWMPG